MSLYTNCTQHINIGRCTLEKKLCNVYFVPIYIVSDKCCVMHWSEASVALSTKL